LSKMIEASCVVVGGHSIRDEETKFGYAVTGLVHPKRVLTNAGAKPQDVLFLTKALGTGVISTAIKKGKAEPAWVEAAVKAMTTLNKKAAEVVEKEKIIVHAMTDITGFGLIGHGREIALASDVSLKLESGNIPILDGALECIRSGYIPGGLKNNRDFAECLVGYEADVADDLKALLFDPQTAGGLLISVDKTQADRLAEAMADAGLTAARIGEVLPKGSPRIQVR
jgi:selenide, water dikinase